MTPKQHAREAGRHMMNFWTLANVVQILEGGNISGTADKPAQKMIDIAQAEMQRQLAANDRHIAALAGEGE